MISNSLPVPLPLHTASVHSSLLSVLKSPVYTDKDKYLPANPTVSHHGESWPFGFNLVTYLGISKPTLLHPCKGQREIPCVDVGIHLLPFEAKAMTNLAGGRLIIALLLAAPS